MKNLLNPSFNICLILVSLIAMFYSAGAQAAKPDWYKNSVNKIESKLVARYGESQKARINRGIEQVGEFWRDSDGGADVFEKFILDNFAGDQETLDQVFDRYETIMQEIGGADHEMSIVMKSHAELDMGPLLPLDEMFASYDPGAHVLDDLFADKIAFVALLNFPLTTLDQRLTDGAEWTRRQWAEARLAQRFSRRVPASVNQAIAKASSDADNYIAGYNIWMYHLLDNDGNRLFPAGMRLLSHWNLRDELKSDYNGGEKGLEKQKMIMKVMERIVDQTIPQIVIDNPYVDWNPYTNEVTPAAVNDSGAEAPEGMVVANDREPDTRYARILECFKAERLLDAYSPTAPTLMDRRFNEDREIREKDVEHMLVQIVSSPLVKQTADLISERLGRKLQPFDIWYNGFRSTGKYSEEELNRIVSKKYPTAEAFGKDIPRFLRMFGFSDEMADKIASNIIVQPARGSGHASGGEMRGQPARLRTRVGKNGMDYKGFNIAVHEMGHNVEQTISMNYIDYYFLNGVPNTAFTEAFAFTFQENDLMLLGLDPERGPESDALATLDDFWGAYEISSVSLVDMYIWRWMYKHPDATPAELRQAALDISKKVWNDYMAPVFGVKDVYLLGIYSHIVHSFLYIPDYAIGSVIAFQVRNQMKKAGSIGPEFYRMAVQGNIAPDLWMKGATGKPVSPDALLDAAAEALKGIKKGS